jgi:hypothetical protein
MDRAEVYEIVLAAARRDTALCLHRPQKCSIHGYPPMTQMLASDFSHLTREKKFITLST